MTGECLIRHELPGVYAGWPAQMTEVYLIEEGAEIALLDLQRAIQI